LAVAGNPTAFRGSPGYEAQQERDLGSPTAREDVMKPYR